MLIRRCVVGLNVVVNVGNVVLLSVLDSLEAVGSVLTVELTLDVVGLAENAISLLCVDGVP